MSNIFLSLAGFLGVYQSSSEAADVLKPMHPPSCTQCTLSFESSAEGPKYPYHTKIHSGIKSYTDYLPILVSSIRPLLWKKHFFTGMKQADIENIKETGKLPMLNPCLEFDSCTHRVAGNVSWRLIVNTLIDPFLCYCSRSVSGRNWEVFARIGFKKIEECFNLSFLDSLLFSLLQTTALGHIYGNLVKEQTISAMKTSTKIFLIGIFSFVLTIMQIDISTNQISFLMAFSKCGGKLVGGSSFNLMEKRHMNTFMDKWRINTFRHFKILLWLVSIAFYCCATFAWMRIDYLAVVILNAS